ncbi:uncharacterized protein PFL1_05837 [Pseudozyma flocculosa PF-1]|uniref:Importin N-terminal domain-containing protein n=1 Tax=Pseudozyma flocculosa PF-1 TaxID=1277687 RepID=A0A061H3R7_9BASI|nr:uncharacterized protein PFL1_05837 [Pseudozyma flocculosa PF-1]EPQ26515.1 hypothetical protein PFL1_05837 [Pseudozyma flocculosa PF-1]
MSDAAAAVQAVVQVLTLAVSQDPAQLSRANQQLEEWEREPRFWLILLQIAFDRDHSTADATATATTAHHAIRTLAIIRFKNGVDKFWRSRVVARVTVTIPADVKHQIRHALFQCLYEPDRTIALQAAVAISRIARNDYPRDWPDLFTNLQRAMVDAHAALERLGPAPLAPSTEDPASHSARLLNTTILMRAADVCAKTLKELESVKILAGKMRMTELSRELLPSLHPIFQQYFAETFSLPRPRASPSASSSASPSTSTTTSAAPADLASLSAWASAPLRAEQVRTSHLLLKAISRLAVADMGMISRTASAEGGNSENRALAFFRSTPHALQTLKDTRLAYLGLLRSSSTSSSSLPSSSSSSSMAGGTSLLAALTKHLHSFGKFFLSLIQKDKGKAAFWDGWTDVVGWYWVQAKDVSPDSLAVPRDRYADHGALIDYPPRFVVQALVLLKKSLVEWKGKPEAGVFGSQPFAIEATDVLVRKLMRLNADDLERWQADPEEWSVGEEQENYELDIRPAAERTLMVLAQHTKPIGVVGEHLWKHLEATAALSPDALDDVLTRDAVYAAVGRCRDYLCRPGGPDGDDDGDDVPTANQRMGRSSASPLWIVVRRRIAWLLWEWSEQVLVESRPAVYALLVELLSDVPGRTDVAVRLASARCIAALADALEFDADGFMPYLSDALQSLATLAAASELHEMESIKTCTDSLSVLIERMGPRVAPHSDALVDLVPMLWQQEDPDCKAKPSVIVFISKILRAIELLPAEGQTAALTAKLHGVVAPIVRDSLSPAVSHLLAKDALSLLYVRALHSTATMTPPLLHVLELAKDLIAQPDYCVEICRAIEEVSMLSPLAMLETYGRDILSAFAAILADPSSPMVLAPVAALDTLVQALAGLPNWLEVRDTWMQVLDSTGIVTALVGCLLHTKESASIATHFVGLVCRIAFYAPGASFLGLIRSASRHAHMASTYPDSTLIWPPLVSLVCQRFENMASARKRKVTALGLAALLDAAVVEQGVSPGNADTREVFAKVPDMIAVWSEAVAEIRESRSNDFSKYTRPTSPIASMELDAFFDDDDDLGGGSGGGWLEDTSPGSARARHIALSDRALTVSLAAHLSEVLTRAQTQDATGSFAAVMQTIDPLVLDMFRSDLASA